MGGGGYYVFTNGMSRYPEICPVPTSAFFCASHEYLTDFNEIWGEVVTSIISLTGDLTGYIMGEMY